MSNFRQALQAILALPLSLRQRRLARARKPLAESEFVQRIVDQGGDSMAAVAVWRRLREWCVMEGFTPYPGDSLASVFGIAEEELDEDLILGILTELNLQPPSEQLLKDFGPVDTPVRVAQLVGLSRRSTAR
jgi:hypothetical protein